MKMLPMEFKNSDTRQPLIQDLMEDFLYHARVIDRDESMVLMECALVDEVDKVAFARRSEILNPNRLDGKSTIQRLIQAPLGLRPHSFWVIGWIATLAIQAGPKVYVTNRLLRRPALIKNIHGRPPLYCALLRSASFNEDLLSGLNSEMIEAPAIARCRSKPALPRRLNLGAFPPLCLWSTRLRNQKSKAIWVEVFLLLLEHGASLDAWLKPDARRVVSHPVVSKPVKMSVYEIVEKCCPGEAEHLMLAVEKVRGFSIIRWLGWKWSSPDWVMSNSLASTILVFIQSVEQLYFLVVQFCQVTWAWRCYMLRTVHFWTHDCESRRLSVNKSLSRQNWASHFIYYRINFFIKFWTFLEKYV